MEEALQKSVEATKKSSLSKVKVVSWFLWEEFHQKILIIFMEMKKQNQALIIFPTWFIYLFYIFKLLFF